MPFLEEGFDYIDVYNKPSLMESNSNLLYISEKTSGFNQNNKHHSQLLNEHMNSTNKWKKIFGEQKFQNLTVLYNGDKYSHIKKEND